MEEKRTSVQTPSSLLPLTSSLAPPFRVTPKAFFCFAVVCPSSTVLQANPPVAVVPWLPRRLVREAPALAHDDLRVHLADLLRRWASARTPACRMFNELRCDVTIGRARWRSRLTLLKPFNRVACCTWWRAAHIAPIRPSHRNQQCCLYGCTAVGNTLQPPPVPSSRQVSKL